MDDEMTDINEFSFRDEGCFLCGRTDEDLKELVRKMERSVTSRTNRIGSNGEIPYDTKQFTDVLENYYTKTKPMKIRIGGMNIDVFICPYCISIINRINKGQIIH